MRYIGSKTSSVREIFEVISKYASEGSFCDPFGGTSTVGSYFKTNGFKVFTGDLLMFAHYFQIAKLSYHETPAFEKLLQFLNIDDCSELSEHLNFLVEKDGWFIENYSVKRKFFTIPNAQKIQAIWSEIMQWQNLKLLNYNENAFLLASLIDSMDKFANTAGTYYAYLKTFNTKSSKQFKFKFIDAVTGSFEGESFLCDAGELVKRQKYDVIYLDPPYNDRKYHQYYHLPETIASCQLPEISGKSGVAKTELNIPSNFYKNSLAVNSLNEILKNSQFDYLLFHYQDNGILSPHKLTSIFSQYGEMESHKIQSLGYSTKTGVRSSPTQLYVIKNA